AADEIVTVGLALIGQGEADGGGSLPGPAFALRGIEPPAAAVVFRRLAPRGHLLPAFLELGGCAEARVGSSSLDQRLGMDAVMIATLGLEVRTERPADSRPLIPGQAEPLHAVEDRRQRLVGGAGRVGVLDPEHEDAALLAGERVVVEGGASAADVKIAGGTRGEAHANRSIQRARSSSRGAWIQGDTGRRPCPAEPRRAPRAPPRACDTILERGNISRARCGPFRSVAALDER